MTPLFIIVVIAIAVAVAVHTTVGMLLSVTPLFLVRIIHCNKDPPLRIDLELLDRTFIHQILLSHLDSIGSLLKLSQHFLPIVKQHILQILQM